LSKFGGYELLQHTNEKRNSKQKSNVPVIYGYEEKNKSLAMEKETILQQIDEEKNW